MEEFKNSIPSQTSDIGYDTYNSLIILNTLAIVILIYMVKLVMFILIRLFNWITCNKFQEKVNTNWSKSMFFSELHAIYIDGFLETFISMYLTL